MRPLLCLCVCAALLGCAHENQDFRVDEQAGLAPNERAALLKLDCSQRREEVLAARDDQQPDADRLESYRLAQKAYRIAAERLETALTREPDLLYSAEGDALRLRQQRCQTQVRTVTDELKKFELSTQDRPPVAPTPVAAPQRAEPPASVPAKKKAKHAKSALARKHGAHRVAIVADASVDR